MRRPPPKPPKLKQNAAATTTPKAAAKPAKAAYPHSLKTQLRQIEKASSEYCAKRRKAARKVSATLKNLDTDALFGPNQDHWQPEPSPETHWAHEVLSLSPTLALLAAAGVPEHAALHRLTPLHAASLAAYTTSARAQALLRALINRGLAASVTTAQGATTLMTHAGWRHLQRAAPPTPITPDQRRELRARELPPLLIRAQVMTALFCSGAPTKATWARVAQGLFTTPRELRQALMGAGYLTAQGGLTPQGRWARDHAPQRAEVHLTGTHPWRLSLLFWLTPAPQDVQLRWTLSGYPELQLPVTPDAPDQFTRVAARHGIPHRDVHGFLQALTQQTVNVPSHHAQLLSAHQHAQQVTGVTTSAASTAVSTRR